MELLVEVKAKPAKLSVKRVHLINVNSGAEIVVEWGLGSIQARVFYDGGSMGHVLGAIKKNL